MRKGANVPVQPDWSLVLGTFTHSRDEGLEELLIAAGTKVVDVLICSTISFPAGEVRFEPLSEMDGENYHETKRIFQMQR